MTSNTVPTDPTVTASCRNPANHCAKTRVCESQPGTIGTVGTVPAIGRLTRLRVFGNAASEPASPESTEPLSAIEEEERIDDGPWIINAESAALLDELEEVDLDDVPVCSCGRYCDTQTLDDAWHCSYCDPESEARRKRTLRLLASAKRIRHANRTT